MGAGTVSAKAYYSKDDNCWYVPIASELLHHMESIEPCRLELKDGQLHITLLGDPIAANEYIGRRDPDAVDLQGSDEGPWNNRPNREDLA